MNIRKLVDYSVMYAGLNQMLERNLPQMELYLQIGKLVSTRTEKGAAVAAAEYLAAKYPNNSGFSPRNLRRMRAFFRTYETAPDILHEALLIGWTQNVVIMEADLSMDQRHWYLRAALQFRWSKAELLRQISDSAHEKMNLDVLNGTCYTDIDKLKQERQDDEDFSCKPQHNLQESNGRDCNEKSCGKVCDGEVVLHFRSCYQSGSNRRSVLSSGPPKAGGLWKLLRRPRGPADDDLQLCRLRFVDRHEPGQCTQYRHIFCGDPEENIFLLSVDGVCWSIGPGGYQSVKYRGLQCLKSKKVGENRLCEQFSPTFLMC